MVNGAMITPIASSAGVSVLRFDEECSTTAVAKYPAPHLWRPRRRLPSSSPMDANAYPPLAPRVKARPERSSPSRLGRAPSRRISRGAVRFRSLALDQAYAVLGAVLRGQPSLRFEARRDLGGEDDAVPLVVAVE